jgi:hypothetical protein
MPRYSAGDRTAVGSTTLPIISIYSGAASTGVVREIGVFNTTTTAVELYLCRLTSTGTQGANLVEARHNPKKIAAACTVVGTHTVLPTLGDDLGYRAVLGSTAGVIWTFGEQLMRLKLSLTELVCWWRMVLDRSVKPTLFGMSSS